MGENELNIIQNSFINWIIDKTLLTELANKSKNNHFLSCKTDLVLTTSKLGYLLFSNAKNILIRLFTKGMCSKRMLKEYEHVFNYYKIETKREKLHPYNLYLFRRKEYFKVEISAYSSYYVGRGDPLKYVDFTPLLNDIRKNFLTKCANKTDVIYVYKNQISDFIERYKKMGTVIHWNELSSQTNIPWTNDIIYSLRDLLEWKELHRNPSIKWNFDLVRKNIDYINWELIIDCPHLVWDLDRIKEFKDYLRFTTIGYGRFTGHYFLSHPPAKNPDYLPHSVSLSPFVKWDFKLIEEFKEIWDWNELPTNNNINWSTEQIKKYDDYINFEYLSINRNVQWTEELIDDYKEEWDWDLLSGNPNLPWSLEFINKYQGKWKWRIRETTLSWDKERNLEPSISTNEGILWDEHMLSKWQNKLDFWDIARNGKISNNGIKIFKKEFDKKETASLEHHTNSDCPTVTVNIYRTGWENLALNKNFVITRELIDFYYQTEIPLTFPVGNFADSYTKPHYETRNIRLLSILKNCFIKGITICDLIMNTSGWMKELIDKQFINESIWVEFIEPIFTRETIEKYLNCQKLVIEYNSNKI